MFFQLQDIGSVPDGVYRPGGYTIGIAILDGPGCIEQGHRFGRSGKIGGDRPVGDIDLPLTRDRSAGLRPCHRIVRVKFKEITGERSCYITIILLIPTDIPIAVSHDR